MTRRSRIWFVAVPYTVINVGGAIYAVGIDHEDDDAGGGESYLRADITVGRVGLDQPPPNWEFD